MFYIFDEEDDLIIKTDDEGRAVQVASWYNGYILTRDDIIALYN